MIVIDRLCYQSRLRYVNAAEKVLYAVLTLALCLAGRSAVISAVIFLVNSYLTTGKGKIPAAAYFRLLMIPAAFLLLSTAAVAVSLSRTPMDLFAFPAGRWYVTCSAASLRSSLTLCAKALAAVSCLYFLSLNTVMTDLLSVLKKLHVPALVLELMMLIYRFLFLLLDTASAVTAAQHCRLGNRDIRTSVRSFGGMAGILLIRALKRSGVLYDAMESRCYDGEIRVLPEEYPPRFREGIWIAAYELLLLAAVVWSRVG